MTNPPQKRNITCKKLTLDKTLTRFCCFLFWQLNLMGLYKLVVCIHWKLWISVLQTCIAHQHVTIEQFFFSLTLYRTGIWIIALEMIRVNFNLDKTSKKKKQFIRKSSPLTEAESLLICNERSTYWEHLGSNRQYITHEMKTICSSNKPHVLRGSYIPPRLVPCHYPCA